MTGQEFRALVSNSVSRSEICRKLGLVVNGKTLKQIDYLIDLHQADISHLTRGSVRKHPIVTKVCPACSKQFMASSGSAREKRTCSYACSNKHFRSGPNNGNYKNPEEIAKDDYRAICLQQHRKACLLCGWNISVDVHHIDGNHSNNNKDNLVPLCPNHHRMAHMTRHKQEISDMIQQIKN